jgi:hypothetical protein
MPTAVEKRRVLLLDVPQMLGEFVRNAVARDESFEVVGDVSEAEAPAAVARERPHFVIVGGNEPSPPPSCRAGFDAQPHLVVLALTGSGRDGTLWELTPTHMTLVDLSEEELLEKIREIRSWSWGE